MRAYALLLVMGVLALAWHTRVRPIAKVASLPPVSIVRPTKTAGAAMGAVKALTADGLFIGHSMEFFDALKELALAADAATRD